MARKRSPRLAIETLVSFYNNSTNQYLHLDINSPNETESVSMAKRGERLGTMQMVPGSIPGGSIEMLGELNSGDSI